MVFYGKFFLDNMTNIRSGEVQILEGWKNPEKRPISRKNQKKGFRSGKLRKISGRSLSDVIQVRSSLYFPANRSFSFAKISLSDKQQ
jgi:hypothetical protein